LNLAAVAFYHKEIEELMKINSANGYVSTGLDEIKGAWNFFAFFAEVEGLRPPNSDFGYSGPAVAIREETGKIAGGRLLSYNAEGKRERS